MSYQVLTLPAGKYANVQYDVSANGVMCLDDGVAGLSIAFDAAANGYVPLEQNLRLITQFSKFFVNGTSTASATLLFFDCAFEPWVAAAALNPQPGILEPAGNVTGPNLNSAVVGVSSSSSGDTIQTTQAAMMVGGFGIGTPNKAGVLMLGSNVAGGMGPLTIAYDWSSSPSSGPQTIGNILGNNFNRDDYTTAVAGFISDYINGPIGIAANSGLTFPGGLNFTQNRFMRRASIMLDNASGGLRLDYSLNVTGGGFVGNWVPFLSGAAGAALAVGQYVYTTDGVTAQESFSAAPSVVLPLPLPANLAANWDLILRVYNTTAAQVNNVFIAMHWE